METSNGVDTNMNPAMVTPPVETKPAMTQEQMIAEIHKFTRQTRNYMHWQMYITIVLVVIPLLASLVILPFALKSLESTYIAPLQNLNLQ